MPTYENVIPLSQASFSGKLPRKPRNQAVRSREYLTEAEVGKLMKAARNTGRHGHRDATLILIAYRHALRVAELVALAGNKSTSARDCYTWCAGRTGWIAHTRCEGQRSAPCGSSSVTTRRHPTSLSPSARDR